jgi:hypothetical protein
MLESNIIRIDQQSILHLNDESEETLEEIIENLQEALGSLKELENDFPKTGTSD